MIMNSRALSAELRALPAPNPSPGLLARIEASRAGGVRPMVLPPERSTRSPRHTLTWVGVGLAAAIVAVLLWPNTGEDGQATFGLFDGTPFVPAPLGAQQRSDTAAKAKYPLLGTVDITRVRAGQWTYDGRMITDGIDTSSQGMRVFSMAQAEQHGRPVWIATTTVTGPFTRGAMGDSLFFEPGSLRLMRRVVYYTGGHANAQDFPDSLGSSLSWHQSNASWHGTLHRLLFQLTPVTRDWRGSAYVALPVDRDRWRIFPIDQRVVGDELVRVPAGTFDCWKVVTTLRTTTTTIWIEKQGHWIVKLSQRGGDAVWEQVLSRVRP